MTMANGRTVSAKTAVVERLQALPATAPQATDVAPPQFPEKLTPMMQQYVDTKAQVGDAILFFRLGDFYEMFFDDALKAAAALHITLTSRAKGDERVPMCG